MQREHWSTLAISGNDTWEAIAELVLATGRDTASFGALWGRLAPEVERWVASPGFLGRVSGDEDHRREVVVRTWMRLHDRDHARLRSFVAAELASCPGRARRVRAWLRRVVKNVGIDYLRGLPEFIRTAERPGDDRRYWHLLEAADEEAAACSAAGTDPRDRVLAAQLLDYLDRTIPARGRRARTHERHLYRAVLGAPAEAGGWQAPVRSKFGSWSLANQNRGASPRGAVERSRQPDGDRCDDRASRQPPGERPDDGESNGRKRLGEVPLRPRVGANKRDGTVGPRGGKRRIRSATTKAWQQMATETW